MGHRESGERAECKWVGYRRVGFCNALGEGTSPLRGPLSRLIVLGAVYHETNIAT